MKEIKLKLSSVQDAKDFVNLASKCNFDIDLYDRHVMIDAKSLIGVLSIDLSNVLTVRFDGDNEAFENFLNEHSPNRQVA